MMFSGGRGKVSCIYLFKKTNYAHSPKTKSNQVFSCGCFLLCPSLGRSDHLLVVIMQVNTQNNFMYENTGCGFVLFCLFACLFNIEKSFDLSFPISEICRIAVCKSVPATRRKKSCVNEHDSDILQ